MGTTPLVIFLSLRMLGESATTAPHFLSHRTSSRGIEPTKIGGYASRQTNQTRRLVPTARAIVDRFLLLTQTIAIAGRSYRVKEAPAVTLKNKKSPKCNEPATAGAAS